MPWLHFSHSAWNSLIHSFFSTNISSLPMTQLAGILRAGARNENMNEPCPHPRKLLSITKGACGAQSKRVDHGEELGISLIPGSIFQAKVFPLPHFTHCASLGSFAADPFSVLQLYSVYQGSWRLQAKFSMFPGSAGFQLGPANEKQRWEMEVGRREEPGYFHSSLSIWAALPPLALAPTGEAHQGSSFCI